MKFPKIYPLTDTRLSGLSHAEQVSRFIAGGATFIQLREKYAQPDEFYAEAKKAIEIAHHQDVKIIINDRADIALALKADGVHLGQDDLPPAEARKVLGDRAIIGFSTHSLAQAVEALSFPVDYIAFGPVFSTSTKEDPDPVVGLELLKTVRQAFGNFPLVAIGGITESNYKAVFAAGADSVALVSTLLLPPENITETAARLISSN
jgi:thiamine-phosphate pyrophosphorylase